MRGDGRPRPAGLVVRLVGRRRVSGSDTAGRAGRSVRGRLPAGRCAGGTIALRLDAGGFLGAAMVDGGEVLGVIDPRPRPRAWSAGEVATLAELAATAAEAIGARAGRRRAEAALMATFEDSAVGQAHADPATGRFLRVNARMAETTGYPAAELVGMAIAELNHPEDRRAAADAFGAMARSAAPDYAVEKRDVRKDGSVAGSRPPQGSSWTTTAARPTPPRPSPTSITAYPRALDALRDREERLRRFADSDVIGIVEADLVGGLARVNDEFLRLTGYTRADFDAGLVRWDDMTPAEHLPRDAAAIAEAHIRGACTPYEKDYVRKDGSRVPVQLGFALVGPRRDEALCYALDLTELKEAERRAVHARRVAEAASRAKDQFLAMLSHELRTPLTPALLATTAALMDPALSADHREAFEAVRRGVELEVRLIDDLLDIAKVASGKMSHQPAVVDPRDLVRRATEPCAPEAEAHGVDLALDLDPPGRAVRADPARLQQVVWNLVKNAIKFTPEGAPSASAPGRRPAGRRDRRHWHPSPSPTATLTGTSPGPGLGGTFTLRLPLATTVDRQVSPAAPSPPPAAARRKILLVEDDAATGRVMARLLARAGFEVRSAAGVGAALDAPGGPFDLLVSDIGLPDGTGLDLLRRPRARGPNPALAPSGFGSDDDHRRAADAGFDAQLTKPVDFAKLVDVIRRVLGDRETPDEHPRP